MSAPERIWAWWEHDSDFRSTDRWEDEARSFADDEYDGAEYIRADTVAEMIRQAVADAEAKALRRAADELKGQGYNTAVRQILALIDKPIMSGDDTGR